MSTPFHPHGTCVWGDIPIGLGTSVVSFKPSGEACQTSGECINHLHHVHHTGITILTSWLLNSPIPFVISRSFWPLITCILQCPQLMTIWSGVSLLSTVMTKMLYSWTFLWFMKWFPFGFSSNHWLVTRLIQHPLVSHILLLFILYFLRSQLQPAFWPLQISFLWWHWPMSYSFRYIPTWTCLRNVFKTK